MPIFRLCDDIIFPPAGLASGSGVLAVGGDLSTGRLLAAYRGGIFPWYSEGDPIIWWSPDPRFVLFPGELRVSKSMRQVLKRNTFSITCDRDFSGVITGCRDSREESGTWITDEMLEAYCELHRLGYAHSVEAWHEGVLAGGLYGVSLGRCFFGESMFATVSNASKAAFIVMVGFLEKIGIRIIDCQVYTSHLESLGARSIPRADFLQILGEALEHPDVTGNWGNLPFEK
jgi:leucyl/phenylalanyl-tRNA---protein transferase